MIEFRRDENGLQEILNGPGTRRALRAFAEPAAAAVRAEKPEAEVVVDEFTARAKGRFTTRHAVSIAMLDVRARSWELRDGLLSRAAARVGLEVRSRV